MARLKSCSLSLVLGLLPLAACGDSADKSNDGVDPSKGGETSDANYVVAARIFSEDGAEVTSYLHLVPSLDASTNVDLKDAIEIPGSAKVYALDDGWLAVGSGEGATITRYEVDPEQGLKKTDQAIDLQPSGVQSLWETLYVASSSKVYYPDRDGAQLVIINPQEMSVEGKIALPKTVREGYLALYSYSAIKRGDELIFSVGWFDWTNDKVLPETGLVVLDTKTDKVTRFDVDDRCGGITTPVTLTSGDTYYVSSALNGAANFIDHEAAKPCALRVRAGEDSFDADYALSLSDILPSNVAGEPVPAGGDSLFLRVLDEKKVATMEGDASWNITGQTVWTWWKWQPGANGKGKASKVTALAPSTADVTFFQVDGRVFGSQTTADYSETTLLELTAKGEPKPALTVPGFASAVIQL